MSIDDLRGGHEQVQPPHVQLGAILQFRIVTVQDDHLVCNTWDGTAAGSGAVLIAKPYLLRRTPFHGKTRDGITYSYAAAQSRTATLGADSENQVVVPNYVAGDVIYAADVASKGGAGVAVDGRTVRLLDMNVDGRAWAKEFAT